MARVVVINFPNASADLLVHDLPVNLLGEEKVEVIEIGEAFALLHTFLPQVGLFCKK